MFGEDLGAGRQLHDGTRWQLRGELSGRQAGDAGYRFASFWGSMAAVMAGGLITTASAHGRPDRCVVGRPFQLARARSMPAAVHCSASGVDSNTWSMRNPGFWKPSIR
jgi:hypothetical protein